MKNRKQLPAPATKTVDDVSREEWIELVESTQNLLCCAMLLLWLNAQEKDEDTSIIDTINRAAAAMTAVGLPQPTIEEYISGLEGELESGGYKH